MEERTTNDFRRLDCLLHDGALKIIQKDLEKMLEVQEIQGKKLDNLLTFDGPISDLKQQVTTNTNNIVVLKEDVTSLEGESESNSTRIWELTVKYSYYAGVLYLLSQSFLKG